MKQKVKQFLDLIDFKIWTKINETFKLSIEEFLRVDFEKLFERNLWIVKIELSDSEHDEKFTEKALNMLKVL